MSLLPAWAISARPPPVPPISAANGLINSPAGKREERSFVTDNSRDAFESFAEPSTMMADFSLSRSESANVRRSFISNPSTRWA